VSKANEVVFERSVADVEQVVTRLLDELRTNALPRDRDIEAEKRRQRYAARQS
jgi:hypothetical protein